MSTLMTHCILGCILNFSIQFLYLCKHQIPDNIVGFKRLYLLVVKSEKNIYSTCHMKIRWIHCKGT